MKFLSFVEQIPDYLYPLPERARGRWLFSKRAYEHRLKVCVDRYGGMAGAQRHCWRLIIWREICHVFGAVVFVVALNYLVVPKSVFLASIVSIVFAVYFVWQEYVLQPRIEHLKQIRFKANLDILAWLTPPAFYWLYLFIR